MRNLDIVIVGGGIGGLCLAQGLKKNGVVFRLYERNTKAGDWLDGYRIHIRPVGSKALYDCLPDELWKSFLSISGDNADGFGFLTEHLEELVHIEEELMVGKNVPAQYYQYAVTRKDLRQILLNGLDQQISFGKSFTKYEQLSNGRVSVLFEDGTRDECDLLIGADGPNSKIRGQLLPCSTRVETNAVAIGGKTLLTHESRQWIPSRIATRMNVVMPADKYFFFNAIYDRIKKEPVATPHQDNYVLWSFIGHKNDFEGIDQNTDLKKEVLRKIRKWDPLYQKLVSEAEDGSLLLLRIKTMCPVKPWATTNVTLMGDAIHNMTPLQGMGANMALFDAATLATKISGIINQGRPAKEAISEYEKIMLKKGFEAVAISMKYTNQAISENRFARFMSRNWFRLCSKIPAIKRMTFGNNWK